MLKVSKGLWYKATMIQIYTCQTNIKAALADWHIMW